MMDYKSIPLLDYDFRMLLARMRFVGLTQKGISNTSGISKSTIGQISTGQTHDPQYWTAYCLLKTAARHFNERDFLECERREERVEQ